MKSTILFFFVLASFAANAQPNMMPPPMKPPPQKCVSMASNDDLLRELRSRLLSGPIVTPPDMPQSIIAASVCNFSTLNYSLTNLQNGEVTTLNFAFSNGTQCDNLRNKINGLTENELYNNELVAMCDYSNLRTFLVTKNREIRENKTQAFSNSTQCEVMAKQINDAD